MKETSATTERFEDTLIAAEEAFWQSVAESYPEIQTGDFDPASVYTFRAAIRDAVNSWLQINGANLGKGL